METVFEVELGHALNDERMVYATLRLPATPFELLDALDKLRILNDGDLTVEILNAMPDIDFLPYRMKGESHKASELHLFNALAERIAQMDPVARCAFAGMVRMDRDKGEKELSIPRLYDLASSTDCCHVVPEAVDDASLGRFYVDGGFLPEYGEIPEPVLDRLDYAKIGREAREGEGGVFVAGGGYVVQHTEFVEAVKDFTPQEPGYAVLLDVRRGEQAVTLKLPATPQEMDAALRAVGAENWQDVTLCCADCKVPALTEEITDSGNAALANRAARMLEGLDGKQTTMFKALLEARGVSNLEDALEMIGWLDQYILTPEYDSPADVGLSHLENLVGPDEAKQMLPYVNLYGFGESMIQRFHYSMTPYGAIERRDGEPIREVFDKQTDAGRDAGNHQPKPRRKHREPSR